MINYESKYADVSEFADCTRNNLDRMVTDVVELLVRKRQSLATAESCTGGLLSELVTSVPGASQVFELGLCTYSNRMKQKFLGVPEQTLAAYGVVSREVALAMVRGLREQSGADLCITVTGLAGPGGGSPEQPVGTVYGGIAYKDLEFTTCLHLWEAAHKDRESIRRNAAGCLLTIVMRILSEDGNQ